jgi:putative aminopeptidase FrvX
MSRADRESSPSRTGKDGAKARGKAAKRASAKVIGTSSERTGASAEKPGKGTPQVLLDLLSARGPSGYEAAPAAVWREAASAFAEVSTDVLGTPLARVAPKHGFEQGARRLLVMGHIDEIGLIVTHIDDDGYLWFGPVGGWDAQILVGQRVAVNTRGGRVLGVVGKKPIHLLRDEDRKKVAEVRDLHIDIGASDGADARERVRIGDVAVIDADPAELPNGRLTSRALDNRLGSFVALEAARLVAEKGGAAWELAAVAVAQEEITFGGSSTSAFSLEPDAAIVVDVTHATDAPGIEIKEIGKHELGSGPVLSRGSTLHPELFELLHETAEREQIPFTVEATARATGTDADAVHLSRGGVPTALVSIPIRYMHSPVELVQLDDVHACARLIAAAALRLGSDTSFAR